MLVGEDARSTHFDVDGNCSVWVGSEAFDEGVVSEDIAATNDVEDGKSVGGRKGRKGEAVKE